MLYSGELIGVLDVFNRADKNVTDLPREFTEQDTNLISLFANAAAGAVYGARLLDQARRRVEELDAIAQVSSALRVASTRGAMAPIILFQLREILHADGALFGTLDPATQNIVIELAHGNLESLTGFILPAGKGLSAQVLRSRQLYTTLNLQEEPNVYSPEQLKNVRTAAIVPLVSQDRPLGVLWVTRDENNNFQPQPFDRRELRILSAISDITANAIQRVSLYEETTHYAEQLETVNAMGNALSETLDLPGIYEKTAQTALDLLPDTAMVTISLFDPQTKLITTAYALKDGEVIGVADLPVIHFDESDNDNLSEVVLRARSLIISDLNRPHKDIQPAEERDESGEAGSRQVPRSALYVPMKAEGRVIGILQLQSYAKNHYDAGDAELMELATNTAASSIQNTRLFTQLKRRVDQLSALHAVDTAIGSTTDLRVSLQSVLENITRQLRVDAADVLLLNSSTLILHYSAGVGFLTSEIMRTSISIGRGPAGKAALDRRMVYIPDLSSEEDGFLRSNLISSERFTAFLAVPLMAKGEVKGVLEIFNRSPFDMDEERRSFLEMLAGQAALAIDNALLFESLEKANVELVMAYDATIEGWSQALELRDQETQGHSARVLDLTLRLASAMNISDKELQDIRRGVLLHDIGKMGIPDAILHKPGPLTDEEWGTMHKHPQYAYDMLAPIVYLRNSLDIPYCHHEKWDGTGYPRGLKAETIPLAARIFSVVDVYDALTSDRPYREVWSREKTIKYIVEQTGIYFDSHVVDIFLKLITV
jgi:HD-GYP domain-containing protein (c-di-GMP phosphodiesterase class II)